MKTKLELFFPLPILITHAHHHYYRTYLASASRIVRKSLAPVDENQIYPQI